MWAQNNGGLGNNGEWETMGTGKQWDRETMGQGNNGERQTMGKGSRGTGHSGDTDTGWQ